MCIINIINLLISLLITVTFLKKSHIKLLFKLICLGVYEPILITFGITNGFTWDKNGLNDSSIVQIGQLDLKKILPYMGQNGAIIS